MEAKAATQTKNLSQDKYGDFVTMSIPENERKSFINLFLTTAGWILCLSTIFTGGALAAGLNFGNSLLAGVVGMLILALFAAPLAAIGAKYGVSTAMLTRQSFGRYGAGAFGLIIALLLGIGWYAWQAAFFGLTLSALLPGTFLANAKLGAVIGGILMMITAMYGYKGISALSFISVPLILIISIFGAIAGIEHSGGWQALLTMAPHKSFSVFTGITMVVGNAAMGAVVLSDISRYAKSSSSGGVAAASGYLFGGVFCVAAGAAMTIATNVPGIGSTPDLPKIMLSIGMGAGALLVLILEQWKTNTANIYSASLGIVNMIPIPQKYQVIVMGLLGTGLACAGIYNFFVPFLVFLGTALPPIAGVILADYYVFHRLILKEHYRFGAGTKYYGLNWAAVLATVIGAYSAMTIKVGLISLYSVLIGFASYILLVVVLRALKIPYTIGSYIESESGF